MNPQVKNNVPKPPAGYNNHPTTPSGINEIYKTILIIVASLVIFFIGILLAVNLYYSSNVEKTKLKYGPIDSVSVPLSKIKDLTVTKSANVTIEKGIVTTIDGEVQTGKIFDVGKTYMMYFSGVKGFTEFRYGDPSDKFVDLSGRSRVYDSNDNILSEVDVFSSYFGKIPTSYAEYLNAQIILPKETLAGEYRWEFIVTDKKNINNTFTAVYNFKVISRGDSDGTSKSVSRQPTLSELQKKYLVSGESGVNKNKNIYINFNKETYYLAWSRLDEDQYHLEFLRNRDNWTTFFQLLTVYYVKSVDLKKYLEQSMPSLEKLALSGVDKKVIGEDTILSFYTAGPNNTYVEYNLQKISAVGANDVRVIVFNKRYFYPKDSSDWKKIDDDVNANINDWTNNYGIYYLEYFIN